MKYGVGRIQSTSDSKGDFAGVGFNVSTEQGRPVVTFGFLDPTDAAKAHGLMKQVVELAADIYPHSR